MIPPRASDRVPIKRRKALAILAATAASGVAGLACRTRDQAGSEQSPSPLSQSPLFRAGVSLAGGEFGTKAAAYSNLSPGKYGVDYQYPSAKTAEYFVANSVGLLRLPFRWERLQPRLGNTLNAIEVERLRGLIEEIGRIGGKVLLDCHNYGRYRIALEDRIHDLRIDEPLDGVVRVSSMAFADFWRRMAVTFGDLKGVAAYGLMNEPHDMGISNWKTISQTACDAIRAIDQKTYLAVAGDGWSSAERFTELNGANAWITDPSDRVVYEAHCYFDQDGSGKYALSYEQEAAIDPDMETRGRDRVTPFLNWCRRNQVAGLIGETGIPTGPGWNDIFEQFLAEVDETSFPVCYWAAGEWWGDYPLSVQPSSLDAPLAPSLRKLVDHAS